MISSKTSPQRQTTKTTGYRLQSKQLHWPSRTWSTERGFRCRTRSRVPPGPSEMLARYGYVWCSMLAPFSPGFFMENMFTPTDSHILEMKVQNSSFFQAGKKGAEHQWFGGCLRSIAKSILEAPQKPSTLTQSCRIPFS